MWGIRCAFLLNFSAKKKKALSTFAIKGKIGKKKRGRQEGEEKERVRDTDMSATQLKLNEREFLMPGLDM